MTVATSASAQVGVAAPRPDEQFDFMNLISKLGLHNIDDESWNLYGQFTHISTAQLPFHAPYGNYGGNGSPQYSLSPDLEYSETTSFTASFALKLWTGAALYIVPEVISELPLAGLHGLGGAVQIFELQKSGSLAPQLYRSRIYLEQTINLGGERIKLESNPQQLGMQVDAHRLVFSVGNWTFLDFMDKNNYASDLRHQFFNLAFLTYAAYDFGSDARGYSWGAMAQLYWDDFTFRISRGTSPINPNALSADWNLGEHYTDEAEIEWRYKLFGQDGGLRLLGYHNRNISGAFQDAIDDFNATHGADNETTCGDRFNYTTNNPNAPDLCFVRKTNDKFGIGFSFEQALGHDIGVFLRAMWSDGRTEVYAYMPADRSVAAGVLAKGTLWNRGNDVAGIAFNASWISDSHAQYLAMGGVDGFIGDGKLNRASESVFEVFYSVAILSSVWLSADYQRIFNPAFNADRGPVDVLGGRIHADF
jgi:hypothetical protein